MQILSWSLFLTYLLGITMAAVQFQRRLIHRQETWRRDFEIITGDLVTPSVQKVIPRRVGLKLEGNL